MNWEDRLFGVTSVTAVDAASESTSDSGSTLIAIPSGNAAHLAEVAINSLAVRDRSLRGVAALEMNQSHRLRFVDQSLPAYVTGFQVETDDLPLYDVRDLIGLSDSNDPK
jgi:hypothetical protein